MTENLFEELKRRKVFKVGAAYLVVAWVLVQAASIGFPAFDAPPWALRPALPDRIRSSRTGAPAVVGHDGSPATSAQHLHL